MPLLRNPFSGCAWTSKEVTQLNVTLAAVQSTLAVLQATLTNIETQMGGLMTASANVAAEVASLTTSVANETTVDQSAVVLLNGIPAMIANAIAQAQAAGATPAQLAAIDALRQTMATNATNLAAAITANTSAAPAPATS